MAVFDDPKKELEALQAQSEAQEDWFEKELDSAKRMIGEVPNGARPTSAAAGVPVRRNPAPAPVRRPAVQDIPVFRDELPPRKGIRGLVILAALELLGIVGIAAYWMVYLL